MNIESLDAACHNEDALSEKNKILNENHDKLLSQFEKERNLRKDLESVRLILINFLYSIK